MGPAPWRAGSGSHCLSHQQGQEQGHCETLGQPQSQASVTSLETLDSVWSIPWPGMDTDPAVVLQWQRLTALGGWNVVLACGRVGITERVKQGQEGLMVCQGHGDVIFCTHLLCVVLGTENIPWRRRYGSKPFPPRGVSINPSLITGGYPCVSVLPLRKTQSKVVSSLHGNHCIQVGLGEPSLVLSLGGCLVSMGLCNLPTIISAPVTVCAYISVLSWKMWNLHCYISYWTFVCNSLNICFCVNTSVLKPWVTLKIKISSVW